MNPHPILSVLGILGALPLAGGDTFEASLSFSRLALTPQTYDLAPAGRVRLQVRDNSGLGLGLGFTPWRHRNLDLTLTATCRPSARSRVDVQEGGSPARAQRFAVDYLALGSRLAWRGPLDWGLAFDVRRENLELDDPAGGSRFRTSTIRPWMGAFVGLTLPIPARVTPFGTLGAAIPLTRTRPTAADASEAWIRSELRAMAPRFEFYLQAGLRF